MGQALYRKYRSTSLSEIVGQEHITTALENAIKSGKISHAYLFTGPRGTGKTSIARILAHAVNDLPYSSDPQLDIIEIDAASNRRIDEIRDLRDKVYIAPASARYKVYIIDEVHMLTREAFNALLKTLEEPPAHVIFILATTDAHKLPETIISRTQRYSFRPVDHNKVSAHLASIAKQEGITIDNDALQLLAEHGEGSFRDSISMLDQVSNQADTITLEMVREQLGMPPAEAINQLLTTVASADVGAIMNSLQALYDSGYRAPAIAEQLAARLRAQLTSDSVQIDTGQALQLLKQLLDVAGAVSPARYLEITLLQSLPKAQPAAVTPVVVTQPDMPTVQAPKPVAKPTPQPAPEPVAVQASAILPEPELEEITLPKQSPPPNGQTAIDDESWTAVLSELKKKYNTVYGIVRMAKTDFSEPGQVKLAFTFAFHQKRINDAKNKKIVTDTIQAVTGQRISLQCSLLSGPATAPKTVTAAPESPTVQPVGDIGAITNVFGGGELL